MGCYWYYPAERQLDAVQEKYFFKGQALAISGDVCEGLRAIQKVADRARNDQKQSVNFGLAAVVVGIAVLIVWILVR
ncbi:hypothetical protein [Pseudomonas sp. RL_15y_Pfl2_60]|uniref:hypothetical protein n=1 Tax=Pseudomonas sp. RL_15y_Pfl2_60 TaxID=3088709 RepID=UPI0030DC5A53